MRFKGKIVLDRFVEKMQLLLIVITEGWFSFSDVSRLCFAATFVSGQDKTMNYFLCTDCNLKCEQLDTSAADHFWFLV